MSTVSDQAGLTEEQLKTMAAVTEMLAKAREEVQSMQASGADTDVHRQDVEKTIFECRKQRADTKRTVNKAALAALRPKPVFDPEIDPLKENWFDKLMDHPKEERVRQFLNMMSYVYHVKPNRDTVVSQAGLLEALCALVLHCIEAEERVRAEKRSRTEASEGESRNDLGFLTEELRVEVPRILSMVLSAVKGYGPFSELDMFTKRLILNMQRNENMRGGGRAAEHSNPVVRGVPVTINTKCPGSLPNTLSRAARACEYLLRVLEHELKENPSNVHVEMYMTLNEAMCTLLGLVNDMQSRFVTIRNRNNEAQLVE